MSLTSSHSKKRTVQKKHATLDAGKRFEPEIYPSVDGSSRSQSWSRKTSQQSRALVIVEERVPASRPKWYELQILKYQIAKCIRRRVQPKKPSERGDKSKGPPLRAWHNADNGEMCTLLLVDTLSSTHTQSKIFWPVTRHKHSQIDRQYTISVAVNGWMILSSGAKTERTENRESWTLALTPLEPCALCSLSSVG